MFEKITLHAATVAVAAALAGSAMAQTNYPTRPITMIVPYAAGGGVDVSARLSASLLEKRIGQAIIVENVGWRISRLSR